MYLTATYSPDDNKLRLYASTRLPSDLYARVKAAGFAWAPKQEFFVAPMWTPDREDLLIELCGEIDDEDTSLVERAEERAERFEEYSDKRLTDAEYARRAVSAIADNIPLGQPILVGHHSEKRARKDAERIENGMRKAVKMWETSKYWERRAEGALRHAKYKERPDVRARRIKTIEADARKQERTKAEAQALAKKWALLDQPEKWKDKADGTKPTREERARYLANIASFPVTRENADGSPCDNFMSWSAWDVLRPDEDRYSRCPAKTVDEVLSALGPHVERICSRCDRWLAHYNNRLAYERAMLADQGGTVTDRTGPEKGGACQCWASPRGGWSYIQKVNKVSVTVLDNWRNGGENFTRTIPMDKLKGVMTKAEVDTARTEGRIKEAENGIGFFLLMSREEFDRANPPQQEPKKAEASNFDAMRDQLKQGVKVVSAPQLFPTPPEIAGRMVELADIKPGQSILEPSAGTGNLISAIRASGLNGAVRVRACELKLSLADALASRFQGIEVFPGDFLEKTAFELVAPYDRIIMNPPFDHGSDIKHIRHAFAMLKPGGRLVALCANGPRQQEAFRDEAELWEDLPAGSFAGTSVNVALLVLTKS